MLLARPLGETNANVTALQNALVELSRVTGNAAINPGSVSGDVDDGTMSAIANALGIITAELPSSANMALNAALIFGAKSSFAKQAVLRYAQVLAAATNAAAAKWLHDHPMTQATGTFPGVAEDPWYTTPLGIGGIVVGAIVLYKLLTR